MLKKILSKLKKKYRQGIVIAPKESEYVEKDTACDLCENLSDCIEDGIVINVQTVRDMNNHYVTGLGAECKKDTVVQARNAYRNFKYLRKELTLMLSDDGNFTCEGCKKIANEFEDAYNTMINKMDILFGEIKE